MYAWGHNRVAQLGIGNHTTVPRNMEGAYFLPCPQLVESLVGIVSLVLERECRARRITAGGGRRGRGTRGSHAVLLFQYHVVFIRCIMAFFGALCFVILAHSCCMYPERHEF